MGLTKQTDRPRRPPRGVSGLPGADDVERGRQAYRSRAWADAHRCFSAADARAPLSPSDLELSAWSAALIGRDDDCRRLMNRLYREHLDRGDEEGAARCAFWASHHLSILREPGRAGGWLARAGRLVANRDCVERG